jgi:hypothetical protein
VEQQPTAANSNTTISFEQSIRTTKMKTTKSKTNMTKKAKGDGMPTRALTAYNLFFAKERQKLMEKQKKDGAAPPTSRCRDNQVHVGFGNLARIVGHLWKAVDPVYKKELEEEARLDKIRYNKEMKVWRAKQKEKTAKEDDDCSATLGTFSGKIKHCTAAASTNASSTSPVTANDDSVSAADDASRESHSFSKASTFGALKSADACNEVIIPFIGNPKELSRYIHPSGNKDLDELYVLVKTWRVKQGKNTNKEDEPDFIAMAAVQLAALTEKQKHYGSSAAASNHKISALTVAEAESLRYLPDQADVEPIDFSFGVSQPSDCPGAVSVPNGTAEEKQSFDSTNTTFIGQAVDFNSTAQNRNASDIKDLDDNSASEADDASLGEPFAWEWYLPGGTDVDVCSKLNY